MRVHGAKKLAPCLENTQQGCPAPCSLSARQSYEASQGRFNKISPMDWLRNQIQGVGCLFIPVIMVVFHHHHHHGGFHVLFHYPHMTQTLSCTSLSNTIFPYSRQTPQPEGGPEQLEFGTSLLRIATMLCNRLLSNNLGLQSLKKLEHAELHKR